MAEIASVKIRVSDLALEWLEAVVDLLYAIDEAVVPLPDPVTAKARRIREVMMADFSER